MGLLGILFVVGLTAVNGQDGQADVKPDYAAISNAEVEFDGTFVGVMARPKGKTKALYEMARKSKPEASEFVKLLDDPEKYIAAHCFLTWLYQRKFPTSSDYNGLKVRILASGTEFPPDQMGRLKKQWSEWLKESESKK